MLIVFKINFFEKILSGVGSECQTDGIQIIILVQTVCKGYQQITIAGNELRHEYSKTCVKRPLLKVKKIGLQEEHSAILSTFIKLPIVIKIYVLSFF